MPQLPDLLVDRLASVIDLARERSGRQRLPPFVAVVGERDSLEVAVIVAYCVLHHPYRNEDETTGQMAEALSNALSLETKAPSQQQMSQTIALALGMSEYRDGETALVRVGSNLLDLAAAAGLIEIRRKRAKFEPKRVYLTEEAYEQIEDIEYRIAQSKFRLPEEPLPEPPSMPVPPGRNWRGRITPEALPHSFSQALDLIRGTAWRVNRFVLETRCANLTPEEWRHLCAGIREEAQRSRQKQLDRLTAFALANKHKENIFYLDVALDYRGRIYHRGPLRFTGADHVIQPLLEFAHGEILTESGAKHLAIYIGYQQGIKDLEEAEAWTYANEEEILRVARDPNKNRELWWSLKEKKRWHYLAAANAWRSYRENEPVHFPCTWDASTSGLQILAVLMRDLGLASIVGLTDGSEGSYYKEVGRVAGEDRDAAKEVCVPLFYGAGLDSSIDSLTEWLKREELPVVDVKARAEKIRNAAMWKAPPFVEVRKWLSAVANVFNDQDKPIRWRTPIGYQVVLDNRHFRLKGEIPVYMKNRRVRLKMQEPGPALNKQKQATSLPAGVVHSLDANILATIVLHGSGMNSGRATMYGHKRNLDLPDGFMERTVGFNADGTPKMTEEDRKIMAAAIVKADYPARPSAAIRSWGVVHDCFGVHPNYVETLRFYTFQSALQEVFGEDWLTELYEQFKSQAGEKIPKPPDHEPMFPFDLLLGRKQLTP